MAGEMTSRRGSESEPEAGADETAIEASFLPKISDLLSEDSGDEARAAQSGAAPAAGRTVRPGFVVSRRRP